MPREKVDYAYRPGTIVLLLSVCAVIADAFGQSMLEASLVAVSVGVTVMGLVALSPQFRRPPRRSQFRLATVFEITLIFALLSWFWRIR